MSQFKSLTERKKEAGIGNKLVCLSHTRKINSDDLLHPHWKFLKAEYAAAQSPTDKAFCSIANSVLHQQRVHFFLSRDLLKTLISQDRNHLHRPGQAFKDESYAAIRAELIQLQLIKPVENSNPNHFKLTDTALLSILKINEAEQESQVIEYIEGNPSGNRFGNRKRNRLGNLDKEDKEDKEAVAGSVSHISVQNTQPAETSALKQLQSQKANTAVQCSPSSAPPLNSNIVPEHQELLNKAMAACPNDKFLNGKQDSLNRYGSFTPGQLEFIKEKAARPVTSSSLPTIKTGTLQLIAASSESADELFQRLSKYAPLNATGYTDDRKVQLGLIFVYNCSRIDIALEVLSRLNIDQNLSGLTSAIKYKSQSSLNKQNRA